VDARSLANTYAQYVGQIFTHEMKPLEVDILVAELGAGDTPDQMYHISYDGSIVDEQRVTVLGGQAEVIAERAGASWRAGWTLREALRSSVAALAGPDRQLALSELEVAVLARSNERRAFQRLGPTELAELLEGDTTVDPPSSEA
jgi:proteasome alpha subunit